MINTAAVLKWQLYNVRYVKNLFQQLLYSWLCRMDYKTSLIWKILEKTEVHHYVMTYTMLHKTEEVLGVPVCYIFQLATWKGISALSAAHYNF